MASGEDPDRFLATVAEASERFVEAVRRLHGEG